jgi:RNA polymerase sigma-70 factor, ECF subfamily
MQNLEVPLPQWNYRKPDVIQGNMLTRIQKPSLFARETTSLASSVDAQAKQGQAAQQATRRRAAFVEIVSQYESRLLRAARHLCGRQEDYAQDLVQDTLVRGYEAYVHGRFQEGTNAWAWLLRILTNVFLTDYNRRKKRECDLDLERLIESGDAEPGLRSVALADQPETAFLAGILDEPLEQALAALSPEMRACVVLVDIEGTDYKEAANALDIPIGTVRSRLSRARLQLHALLINYARERRLK